MKNENVFKKHSSNLITIFRIIKCFMNNYNKYKCYNLYKTIENAKIFLEQIYYKISNFETSNIEYYNYLKINSEEELLEKIFFHQVYFQLIFNIKEK